MSSAHDEDVESYNPWSVVNLVFSHLPSNPRGNELLKTIAICETLEEKCQNTGLALDQVMSAASQARSRVAACRKTRSGFRGVRRSRSG